MPTIDNLQPAIAASDSDVVLISQAGTARKLTRATLLAGTQPQLTLAANSLLGRSSPGVGGPESVHIGAGLALSSGVLTTQSLPLNDVARPEDFGALGDGVADDTAAVVAAVATGKPVLFGSRTYIINGQWTIATATAILIGTPGATILRRASQTGSGAWIAVQSSVFRADGIIFDANGGSVGGDNWGVFVSAVCSAATVLNCRFTNAIGAVEGAGLVLQGGLLPTKHVVHDCEFSGNATHGLWVQACRGVEVVDCLAHDNGQYGICVDFNDPTFVRKASLVTLAGNRAWANQRGISVGNFNATNAEPPTWGNANPDVASIVIHRNNCHNNIVYGIAAAGTNLNISGNLLVGNGSLTNFGGGILANVAYTQVADNMISGTATYGIDCGGSQSTTISGNQVQDAMIGVNAGGGINIRVIANSLLRCSAWAVVIANVEADATERTFGVASYATEISDNWIYLPPNGWGIWLRDGPQAVLISRNNFVGEAPAAQALRTNTDTIIVEENRYNLASAITINPMSVNGRPTLVFPDIIEDIIVTFAPDAIRSMLSSHQVAFYGQICFVKLQSSGSGYSQANIIIGGAGTGATATAIVAGGAIVGFVVTNAGTGYGPPGTIVPVTIVGDGQGAQAVGIMGPRVPDGRRLRITCYQKTMFAHDGALPAQENWTSADTEVAANSAIEWIGTGGAWRAAHLDMSAFYGTDGLGGALVRSRPNADIIFKPTGAGRIRITSDAETSGVLCLIGRGSPEARFAAPPGSDYRDLNGGAGSTLWVKQIGDGTAGWFAVG